jgi:hypothetical protein
MRFLLLPLLLVGCDGTYKVTTESYADTDTASAVRESLEQHTTSLPHNQWHLVHQKGHLLIHATASCLLPSTAIRALDAHLEAELGPFPMGPLTCDCAGHCTIEK